MALQYRTVVGRYTDTNGDPLTGYLEFTPTNSLVHTYNAVIPIRNEHADLDDNGEFSVELLCTDNAEIREEGWLWFVEEKVENPTTFYMEVKYDTAELDIADVYMTNVSGPYYGIQGPPGPSAVSSDIGNASTIGSDGFIYTPGGGSGPGGSSGGVFVMVNRPDASTDLVWVDIDDYSLQSGIYNQGSESPTNAPYRPAYAQDSATGLFYKIGGMNEVLVLDINDPVPVITPVDTLIVRIERS